MNAVQQFAQTCALTFVVVVGLVTLAMLLEAVGVLP